MDKYNQLYKRQNFITIITILAFLLFSFKISAQRQTLWVGESYTCDATSAIMGFQSDENWTTSGGYLSLSGSGHYRKITITQYFEGTASVTYSWNERLTSNSQSRPRSYTWYFTCRENPVYITPNDMTLSVGESDYVGYYHEYENDYTYAADVYFNSSNPNVATVSRNGQVVAKAPGTTYINVYSKVSSASKAPYCLVTVRNIDVQSVTIPQSISIVKGDTKQLSKSIYPSNATVKNISWHTIDTSIATINSSGELKAIMHGSTKVYCIVNNTVKSNEAILTVSKPTLTLCASHTSGLLQKGTKVTLSANDANAEIYYTIDGATPSKNSLRYDGSVIIDKNLTLRAIAYHDNYNTSDVLEKKFEVTSLEIIETFPTNTMREYIIPYIKFNSKITKGDTYDLIKVYTSAANNILEKIIISDNIVYIIPQDHVIKEGTVFTIDIPEGAFNNKYNGERCIASKIALPIAVSNSLYSLYSKEMYAGNFTSCAILSDGTLLRWGSIPYKETFHDSERFIHDSCNAKISCQNDKHTAYIDNDDNLWIWGSNFMGCIGDGTEDNYYDFESKVKIMGNIKEVSIGDERSTLALTNDGVLYGWGSNLFYQLTSKSNKYYVSPQKLMTDVKHIHASRGASYIIKNDGSLWFRGTFYRENYGSLISSITSKNKEWQKIADNVIHISSPSGDYLPMFITSNNTLHYCSEEISDYETYTDYARDKAPRCLMLSDLKTFPIATDVIDVSGSYYGGMYLKKDGSLWSWGRNDYGQRGNGSIKKYDTTTPAQATKVMNNVKNISTSWNYSLMLTDDGSIWGCGDNSDDNINPYDSRDNYTVPELIWQSKKAPIVTDVRININKLIIGKGEQLPLSLIVEPSNAFCNNITWKSNNESIATVSQRGIVTGISEGEATIAVTVKSDGSYFMNTCKITIGETTDIQQIQKKNITYRLNKSILQLDNLQPELMVSIYKANGMKYFQEVARTSTLYIPLTEKGIYIVSVGCEQFKIVNQ